MEKAACTPRYPDPAGFNPNCVLPHGVTIESIKGAMNDFCEFLGSVNTHLNSKQMPRMESILMQANFSSMVGEFVKAAIPKRCNTIVANCYHNGHPDLIPVGMYPNNKVKRGDHGIEVKASRYHKGWQGHNAEHCWLMVCVFTSSRPTDSANGIIPIPFGFLEVLGAQLEEADWLFSGRKEGSRRTITASVLPSGYAKMKANWIYREPAPAMLHKSKLRVLAKPNKLGNSR